MKQCSTCKVTKDLVCFHKDNSKEDKRATVCADCRRTYDKVRSNNVPMALYRAAKARCAKSRLEFDIQPEDIIIPEKCPLLGIPLYKEGNKRTPNSPSLDRIDSTQGYKVGNVQVISWRANDLKKDATLAELKAIVNNWEKQIENII